MRLSCRDTSFLQFVLSITLALFAIFGFWLGTWFFPCSYKGTQVGEAEIGEEEFSDSLFGNIVRLVHCVLFVLGITFVLYSTMCLFIASFATGRVTQGHMLYI